MLVSTALGINLSQPLLDFVDVDLEMDFPLYVDPIGFINPIDRFAEECQADISDFFQAVLNAILAGDDAAGEELLAALQEPNETHFGVSTGVPRGRGIGRRQAQQILENLKNSPAARTGLLTDLTDCALFIDGIGADKVSDITTNIIRRNLIDYTQQQFERLGIPIENNVPTGRLWMRGEGRWNNDEFDRIPIVNGHRLLLVPKRYVRWRGGMQQLSMRYYNHFVTNFIKEEQLRTNGHLVRVVQTKKGPKQKVFKEDIAKDIPPTKSNIARFSVENPDVYRQFRAVIGRRGSLALKKLMEIDGNPFDEGGFSAGLSQLIDGLPSGRPTATSYHHLIAGLITYIFYPILITPSLELEINQGRKRIDVSFANAGDTGFFAEVRIDPFLMAREIMVECKNYQEDLANNEIDQMIGRFDPRRGRLGFIACRSVADAPRLLERCRDAFRAQQGAIIVFTDADFKSLLEAKELVRREALELMCRSKFRALLQ